MKTTLTKKQQIVLSTIRDLAQKLGKSPTYEEIRQALGYSGISSVQLHIDALKKKGVLKTDKYQKRSFEIMLPTEATVNIPLVGNISCGTPLLAEQNIVAYIPYKREELQADPVNYFFLRAVGDSMDMANIKNKAIDDGDIVLVKRQPTADIGQRIVALIGDEATIKKLARGDGYMVLAPESTNPQNKPIYLFEDFAIQGIVCDVLKKGDRKNV
jgi:repressor LexA